VTAPVDPDHGVPILRKDFSFSRSASQDFSVSRLCSAGVASDFSQHHSHSVCAPLFGFLLGDLPARVSRAHSSVSSAACFGFCSSFSISCVTGAMLK
jgi:hypothetical protein